MLEYITVDKSGININKIVFILPKVQGKTKLFSGGRYFKSRWLFCYSNFKIFQLFSIFRLSTIFLIFSDTGVVFSRKFYIENIFFGIFLTEFEAGTAKYQNFSNNIFFIFKIFIYFQFSEIFNTIWGAENFCEVIFWGNKYMKNIFSEFRRNRVDCFAHFKWNCSWNGFKEKSDYRLQYYEGVFVAVC